MTIQARKTLREKQNRLSYLIESELEKAELVIAIKAITDKLQTMAESLVKIEADDLMPMLDSLKVAFGPQVAEQFNNVATSKLRELVENIRSATDGIGNEIIRLEKAVNGEPTNDMNMPNMGGEDVEGADEAPELAGGEMDGAPEAPEAPEGKTPELGGEEGAAPADLGDDSMKADFSAAGRPRKESASKSGRRLVEYKSASFEPNLNNLSVFDHRAGAIAFEVESMIEAGRFDGEERAALANVLSYLASHASDATHWVDPDEKVDWALGVARVDVRVNGVKEIIKKFKRIAHILSLKHDGVIESQQINKEINALREAKNPDALVLKEFRRILAENGNATRAVHEVARKFSIDASDVIAVIREAKTVVKKAIVPKKKVVKEFDMKPTPKSKRGMFKGVSQADLRKRLTAAKKQMKTHEDNDEKVPHKLRSKVSQLNFALRAKHDWGKVKENTAPWNKILDNDTKKLAEAVPNKPKTPQDLRIDRATQQQQAQPAQGNSGPGNFGQTNKPTSTPPTGQNGPSQQPGQPPMQTTAKPQAHAPIGASSGNVQGAKQFAVQPSPNNTTENDVQKPGTPVGQSPKNNADNANTQEPKATTIPVGQSSLKGAVPPTLPGNIINTVPTSGVTLMSKQDKPFPKPGSPLISSTGRQTGQVTETKKKSLSENKRGTVEVKPDYYKAFQDQKKGGWRILDAKNNIVDSGKGFPNEEAARRDAESRNNINVR